MHMYERNTAYLSIQKPPEYLSIIGPTTCTFYFQFIAIKSLYMFRALIGSSSWAMHIQLVYFVLDMSAGCSNPGGTQPT
jgi:hypothetical protein